MSTFLVVKTPAAEPTKRTIFEESTTHNKNDAGFTAAYQMRAFSHSTRRILTRTQKLETFCTSSLRLSNLVVRTSGTTLGSVGHGETMARWIKMKISRQALLMNLMWEKVQDVSRKNPVYCWCARRAQHIATDRPFASYHTCLWATVGHMHTTTGRTWYSREFNRAILSCLLDMPSARRQTRLRTTKRRLQKHANGRRVTRILASVPGEESGYT
ncbi:hypothetical protein PM082_012092 [Marasmius tenuissimus]|nr:hypothetical protein PM082_012092 [Marasmius tenuissimus]